MRRGNSMDYEHWLQRALDSIERTEESTIFVLKALFQGFEWESLAKGDRLQFGKYFKTKVMTGKVPNVQYIGKAQNNSAQYMKVQ